MAADRTSASATERIEFALSWWNQQFVDALPRFGALLRSQLVDVVPARLDDEQDVLLYVTKDGDEFASWIGTDPRLFGSEPRTWDKLPIALQRFLRETHPSLGINEYDTCGLTHPSRQISIYERTGFAEAGVAADKTQVGEYNGEVIDLSDIYELSWDTEQHDYVTSPKFQPGELAFLYEADFEMVDFWPSLDDMLCMPYKNEVF
ncbi:hypothetical protein [Williamsia sp.]|uniref:hypothetical protein n=1 Tax=Williamsia sp. TaxID=1872085 RepID=UPI001A2AF666|nr:hypothetical protein [Williamsia sp.]MBJ7287517.1 hypothetical protein [Williamsia sp.]